MKDTEGRFVLANMALARTMGAAGPEELVGKSDYDFYPKEQADEYAKDERRLVETKCPLVDKVEPKTVAGSARSILVTKVPVFDERGAVVGVVGISRDVTDQKHREQALTHLTRLYREISLTNQLIVRETDRRRLLAEVCRIAVEDGGLLMAWIGFLEETSDRLRPVAFFGKEEGYLASITVTTDEEPAGEGPTGVAIRENRHLFTTDIASDSRMAPWREAALARGYRSSAAFPLRKAGRPIGALSVYAAEPNYFTEDELRLMDELTMDLSYALENLDRERDRARAAAELRENEIKRRQLEQQLVQAQKFESLGTLASGIAHDFNNLLAIIMGHASLLAERSSGQAGLAPSVAAITKATERGADIVRQLLTFARKTESRFESVQLNEVVLEGVRLIRETFPKTVAISVELHDDLPPVSADATQLHQVLMNLCINARDAMPAGGELGITTRLVDRSSIVSRHPTAARQRYAGIRIADTGIGMDEHTLKRAFDPFFTTKGPGKGTGLGLALAYSIVTSHEGIIEVESELGAGTVFTIYLPVCEEPAVPPAPQGGQVQAAGGRETVLVVEDEEMLLELVTTTLIERGYEVLSAHDGEEGIATYEQNRGRIAVVVADLGLPKLGGEQLFARIRSIDPSAKVILASGLLTADAVARLRQLGAEHLLGKPFLPEVMLRLVRSVIDGEA